MKTYTSYNLKVRNITNDEEYDNIVAELKEADLFYYAFCDGVFHTSDNEAEFASWEPIMWTNHTLVLKEISEKYPELLFELTCYDEDGSTWREYFENGLYEFCAGYYVYEEPEKINWH